MSTSAPGLEPRLRPVGPILFSAFALLAACRPAATPESPPAPAAPATSGIPESDDSRAFVGSDACADCHAAQALAHASSPHALDLQAAGETIPHADSGRPIDDDSVLITHRIGTRRRVAWLGAHEGSLQLLPAAWSLTERKWVDHRLDDGGPASRPEDWQLGDSDWLARCAGCHPSAASAAGPSIAMSPEEARGLVPGIGCEHCHGPGAAHVRIALESPERGSAIRDSIVLSAPDAWEGCAHCHADGETLPLRPGEALRPRDAVSAHRVLASAISALRPDGRFFADGRPARSHALSVQSLSSSACFREGELRCTSCHDPHGGGLKKSDPDASCRSCHALESSDGHSGHELSETPVPLSGDEPQGPDSSRLPGCVDCHAPALLSFGAADRARDHAFGLPEPELTRDFAMPDACSSCHAGSDPRELIDWLEERFPDRQTPRHARAAAFRRALGLSAIGESALAADAVEPLLALLADEAADPGLRASAASALGKLGAEARAASASLLAATRSDSVALAQSAAAALGTIGTQDIPALVRVARSHEDWRVRIVAAASLDALGDAEGSAELEVLAADSQLPPAATGQARLQLGLALLRRGLLERAIFQLEDAIRLNGQSVPGWLNLGVARAGLGDHEGARLAWLTVLDLEPGNLAALTNLQREKQRRGGPKP